MKKNRSEFSSNTPIGIICGATIVTGVILTSTIINCYKSKQSENEENIKKHIHLYVRREENVLYKECEGYKIVTCKKNGIMNFQIRDEDDKVIINGATDDSRVNKKEVEDGLCNSLTLDEPKKEDTEDLGIHKYKVFRLEK